MNKKRVHTPEGVRDVYGTEYGQRSKLKAKLNKVFASYGYEGIRTPGFEFFDVFNSEKGTVSAREMFKFFDREGNTLVLRPMLHHPLHAVSQSILMKRIWESVYLMQEMYF